MGSGGEITIDGTQVSVASDGLVAVDDKPVGTVKIVDFKEKESIQPVGNSLFINTLQDNEEIASTGFSIKQGFLESSNVSVMDELVNLINCTRAFETYDAVKEKISEANSKLSEMPRLKS
jgi:flagellar basal-body rod protein FlgG